MPEPPGRRTLLQIFIGVGSAAIGALVAVPGVSYLLDPVLRGRKPKGRWLRVADLKSLSSEGPVLVPVIGEQVDAWTKAPATRLGSVWLRRLGEDRVEALTAECPHLGCAIGYDRERRRFQCPCHDSAFSDAGQVQGGPSPRDMDPLDVRIKDKQVHVRFVRFRAQTKERVEVG